MADESRSLRTARRWPRAASRAPSALKLSLLPQPFYWGSFTEAVPNTRVSPFSLVTVMSTSTRLFQGRVVEDSERKKGESLLASTPVVVLSAILGRIPTIEEYRQQWKALI